MPGYGYLSRFIHARTLRCGLERNPGAFLGGRTRLGIHDPLGPSGGSWSYDHFPAEVKHFPKPRGVSLCFCLKAIHSRNILRSSEVVGELQTSVIHSHRLSGQELHLPEGRLTPGS
jgi:hypothetical protein